MVAVTLDKECLIVQNLFIECPRVFCQAQSRIRPKKLGQINGVSHGVRDRQVGMGRINIDWRHVNFHFRRQCFEIEATNSPGAEPHGGIEFHLYPFGIFSDLQREALRIQFDLGMRTFSIRPNRKFGAEVFS